LRNFAYGVAPAARVTSAFAINATRVSGWAIATLGLVCCLAASAPAPAAGAYSADSVKAEFLYRFAGYVEWPSDQPRDAPFTIAVTAADGVFAELQRLTPGRTIQNRPVEIRKVSTAAELQNVQILYVPSFAQQSARVLLSAAIGRPILVVTDEADGLVHGSIVNFVESERHVRFEISLTAAERSNLKINSGLLSVASHVEGGRPRADIPCWQSPVFGPAAACLRGATLARVKVRSYGPLAAAARNADRDS
jgi:hypothetical protein